MELTKLFEVQRGLDAEIEKNHPVQPGEDRLDKVMLALQVELSECCNSWRGFKFWSINQKAKDDVLEEFVDVVHFVLSLGNRLGVNIEVLKGFCHPSNMRDELDSFMWANKKLLMLYENNRDKNKKENPVYYMHLFNAVMGIGERLGFTFEQIEKAYLSKNQTNYDRQANGY